jgi:hypothetical protein
MLNDLRYAFRLLRRRPGFAIGTAVTIALATGGSVAMCVGAGIALASTRYMASQLFGHQQIRSRLPPHQSAWRALACWPPTSPPAAPRGSIRWSLRSE